MTVQDKREYLYRYRALTDAISLKWEECDKLLTVCEKSTTALSDAPSGGVSSREDMYIKLVEVEDDLRSMVRHRARLLDEILRSFNALGNDELCSVLTCIYIFGMSETETAKKIKRSRKYIHRKHNIALEKLVLDFDK